MYRNLWDNSSRGHLTPAIFSLSSFSRSNSFPRRYSHTPL